MKRLLVLATLVAMAGLASASMDRVLEALAGPDTRGRAHDTDGPAAADFLLAHLADAGAVAQAFTGPGDATGRNVVVLVPGTQADAGWIVVGAHFDHLGLGEAGSANAGQVHFGADDNASGCAVLAELVSTWDGPRERGIAFVFFDGEEQGLLGSRHFVQTPPEGVDAIAAMINLDTVGRLADGGLTVFGVESSPGFADAVAGINSAFGLDLKTVARSSGTADDMAFAEAGIPALHLFTGAHATYHRPGDTLDALDRDGLTTVLDFTFELTDYLSRADVDLTFVPAGAAAALADPARATEGRRRVSFGSIPDFQATDVEGVKITGVIPGSPAEKAGLQAGDVIVGFAGGPVEDLTDYSEAMKRFAPGDVVEVEFLRDGERRMVEVTLVERR